MQTSAKETKYAQNGKAGDGKNSGRNAIEIPAVLALLTGAFFFEMVDVSFVDQLAEQFRYEGWRVLLIWVVGMAGFALAAGVIAAGVSAQHDPRRKINWRSAIAYFLFIAIVPPIAGAVMGKALKALADRAVATSWIEWSAAFGLMALAGILAFPVFNSISRLAVVSDEPDAPAIVGGLKPDQQPHALLIAMSRPPFERTEDAAFVRRLEQRLGLLEGARSCDPFDPLVAREMPNEGAYTDKDLGHPYIQTLRSLQKHFGQRAEGPERAPRVTVFVSKPEPASDYEHQRWGVFQRILQRTLKLRFGTDVTVEALGAPGAISVTSYDKIHNAIGAWLRQTAAASPPIPLDKISIDITSATKVYSAAAAIAGEQVGVHLAYVADHPTTDSGAFGFYYVRLTRD